MAETESDHRFGQCRCCLDVGYHKDIAEPHHRNGARETYRETFLKCFNLVLSTNTRLTNMICTSCISRLNDASEFVTMVVESEKQLLKQINNTSDIEFINVTEDHDGGVCNHEEDDNNLMKVEDDVDCSNVEGDIIIQEEEKINNNDNISIKQETDMEFYDVEDKEIGNMQDDNDVSLKQEDEIKCNDIDGEEVNTQVAVVSSQAEKTEDHNKSIHDKLKMAVESTLGKKILQIRLTRHPNSFFKHRNVNSTTDLKLTTQEAEHIAADMDLSRKKQKTDTKCHSDEINNASTECLDAVIKSDNIFKNCIYYKTNEYSCDLCKYGTNKRNDFKYHVKVHSAATHYICDTCCYITTQKNALISHFRLHTGAKSHTGEKPYSCKICDKEYSYKNGITRHILTHTGEKPHACDICDKKFARKEQLKMHVRTHTGEKPYACKICDKKFTHNIVLTRHIMTHTGEKPHACKICDKKFAQAGTLTKHIRTHTGEKPYACDICDKKFSQSSALTCHVGTHTGEKPYVCEICEKKYSNKSNLKRHVRTHTGKKLYACDICNKKFARNDHLTQHAVACQNTHESKTKHTKE